MQRAGGEEKGAAAEEEDAEGDLCLICWCEPQKYGISTECTHFFCEDCIAGHLNQVQQSGEFPGYCPVCKAAAPSGGPPAYGRITGPAMTFLESKGVIDKEFQFRFMNKQDGEQMLFFACPNKCGNYLVDVDPTFVLLVGK